MFYTDLTLAFRALSPALPAASVTPGVAIATCFAPEENCNAFASDAVDGAGREILASAYSLTTGSGILEALVRAAQRGVDVRVIADRTTPCGRRSGLEALSQAGGSVWIDRGVRIAHAKSMVIDGKVTLIGSMNWSGGATGNSEDLNLVVSPEVAETYASHWRQRLTALGALRRAGRMVPAAHRGKSPVNRFGRLLWRVLDGLDYWVMDARLRIVDAVCGPEPETAADRQRVRERERLGRALQRSSWGHAIERAG